MPAVRGKSLITPLVALSSFILGALAGCNHVGDGDSLASRDAKAAPGATIRDGPNAPEMIVLPPGSVTMGSPAAEPGHDNVESPQRTVTIRYRLAVAKYEVTLAEFKRFVAATNRAMSGPCWADLDGDLNWSLTPEVNWLSPGFSQSDSEPAVCVSWHDALAYAEWISRETGRAYRLLSEAEWEYAARAGVASAYPWGGLASHAYANYGRERCCAGLADGRDRWIATAPVGSFPANAFGLYDMHGNVREWVADCWRDNYGAGQPSDGYAFNDNACSKRVIRGGSWDVSPQWIRSAARYWDLPQNRGGYIGFRLARTLS